MNVTLSQRTGAIETLTRECEVNKGIWHYLAKKINTAKAATPLERELFDKVQNIYQRCLTYMGILSTTDASRAPYLSQSKKLEQVGGALKNYPALAGNPRLNVQLVCEIVHLTLQIFGNEEPSEKIAVLREYTAMLQQHIAAFKEEDAGLQHTLLTVKEQAEKILAKHPLPVKDPNDKTVPGSLAWVTNNISWINLGGDLMIDSFKYFSRNNVVWGVNDASGDRYEQIHDFPSWEQAKHFMEFLWHTAKKFVPVKTEVAAVKVPPTAPLERTMLTWAHASGVTVRFGTINQYHVFNDFAGGQARVPCTLTAGEFLHKALLDPKITVNMAPGYLDGIVKEGKRKYASFCQEIALYNHKFASLRVVRQPNKTFFEGLENVVWIEKRPLDGKGEAAGVNPHRWHLMAAETENRVFETVEGAEFVLKTYSAEMGQAPAGQQAVPNYGQFFQLREVADNPLRWDRFYLGLKFEHIDSRSPFAQAGSVVLEQNRKWSSVFLDRCGEMMTARRQSSMGFTLTTRRATSGMALLSKQTLVREAVNALAIDGFKAPLVTTITSYIASENDLEYAYYDSHGASNIWGNASTYMVRLPTKELAVSFLDEHYQWDHPGNEGDPQYVPDHNRLSINYVFPK